MSADDELDRLSRLMRRIAQWIAVLATVAGAWFLFDAAIHSGSATTFRVDGIAVATGGAVICLALALAVLTRTGSQPASSTAVARLTPVAVMALCLGIALDTTFGTGLLLGETSLVAIVIGFTVALTLFVGQTRYSVYEGALATLALAAAFVLLQGYVLGAPLHQGSLSTPIAAPTALMLWCLALATLLRADPREWPLRVVLPTNRLGILPSPKSFIWLALLFASVVLSSGYFWYAAQRDRVESQAVTTLRTVADLKAGEIALWYSDIRTTVTGLAVAPFDAGLLRAAGNERDPRREALQRWLETVRRAHGIEAVVLLASDGRRLVEALAPDARPLSSLAGQFQSLNGDTLQSSPVYAAGRAIRKVYWVPLQSDAGGRPEAWVAFVIAVDRELYPRLARFPAEFRTGDFSLWQVERDSVRLLSPPQDSDIAPLRLSLPRDSTVQTDIFGPLVTEHGYEGPGFGSQPIRAVGRDVPGTEWQLVAKVDSEELRKPVFTAAVRATAITLAFLLGAAAIIWALWYRRDLARTKLELALIADRERGIREIEASEQRYARAMRGTTDGLWDMNLVTGEAYVSPRWRAIAGVPDDRNIRSEDEFRAVIHPDDRPLQAEALRAHLEEGKPYDIELRVHPDLGVGTRWIRTRADVERDENGTPVWMSGAITDVTKRRATEEELQRTARLLRVRSAINQAIVRAENVDALLRQICEILVSEGGYRMAWIGRKENGPDKLVRPLAIAGDERGYLSRNPVTWGEEPRGQGPTGRSMRSGKPEVAQHLLTEVHFEPWRVAALDLGYQSSVAIPLIIDDEIFGGMMLYAGEPNAFDEAELELLTTLGLDVAFGISAHRSLTALREQREQLELFRLAVDRSRDAIFVADASTGRFVDFNHACLEQLGYSAEELKQLGPADVVPDFAARGGIGAVTNMVRAAGGIVRPSLHRRKDGTEIPVEVALSVLDLGNRTVVLGIARDISDRLRADADREELQAMLTRAGKMESVGRLAGGVAHDFNNLLTVINATAELALSEVGDESPLSSDLQEIRAAGERAAILTRQLLAFSRQQVLKREVLNLNDVVSGFLNLLSRVIGEDIHVEVKLGRDVPNVVADANQLEQVLMNLCVNARDAMPRGGTLTIGTAIAEVDEDHAARREGMAPGRYAMLTVSDTGVGMDKATLAKIFEPFFTTKETGRGTGLGLATVYGIIKQTGGSVYVYSEPGKGSAFHIYLPPSAAEVDAASVERPAPPKTGQETILVVEDEESIRMVARRVLQRAGYTVLEADSGHSALEVVAAHEGKLDLVMTDLVMPGMGGIELAAKLRTTHPALKFLFTSGYSAEAVSDQFVHDGEWNFIGKPYGLRELTEEIRRVLDA